MPRLIERIAQDAALSPQDRTDFGIAELTKGSLRDGFALYESRWDMPGFRRLEQWDAAQRLPNLRAAVGKRVLLWQEQGLGDVIKALRFVPAVARLATSVVLAVEQPLKRLAERIPGVGQVVVTGDTFDEVDYYCSLLSLPFHLRTRLATLPGPIPYLTLPPGLADAWAARLGPKTRFRVGLAISGNAANDRNAARSIPATMLMPLFGMQGVEFHCLQNQLVAADRSVLIAANVSLHTDRLTDLAEAAALAANMDLVISVCTSAAHLAGAFGLPVWIPLCAEPHWLWLRERLDSPWYPSARLFRQSEAGRWDTVVEQMRAALVARMRAAGCWIK